MRLIIATRNKGKFREIKKLLNDLPLELTYIEELNQDFTIKEDGKTFFDNALKKAVVVSKRFKEDLIVGEDSGIEVNYLDNQPGVLSKRFAGKKATDFHNNLKLLNYLEGVPFSQRKARYRCALALVKDLKLIRKCEGTFNGFIYDKMVGSGGFGYDPLFYLPQFRKTVAQIPLIQKNTISHRAQAFIKLKKFLANYLKNK